MSFFLLKAAINATRTRESLERDVHQQAAAREGVAWTSDIEALERARADEESAWGLLGDHNRGQWGWSS